MKILHLVCNSHLDPVWQWDWDEGASCALATFYAACNLLDKYDFVFCHNEVILYEYIEKYDPELFKRIQDLAKKGKWRIMGGWYCQPDVIVPSGESLIRQCSIGREYFKEKFDQEPRTALNFDSFGHTRGIPQILKKSGFDSYIFCRPMRDLHPFDEKDVPHGPYLWKSYDGSKIKALRFEDDSIYMSNIGKAKEAIERKERFNDDLDTMPILWGMGNHGGVSSEKDLNDIMILKDEKKGEWEIIHSTLEDYFDSVDPKVEDDRQYLVFAKSYSSISSIKQAHDSLENALYFTEKICSAADMSGKYTYNKEVLKEAEKILCQIEFHDVMSGTAIKTGTDSSIRKASRAIEILKEEMGHAFFALSRDLPKVTPNDDNLVIFNPYPYDYDGLIESEFYTLFVPDWQHEFKFTVYDLDHKETEFQLIRPESNINNEHRIRLLYKVHVPAMGITQYGVHYELMEKLPVFTDNGEDIIIKDNFKTVIIGRKTGLLESYNVEGKEYLKSPALLPCMFDDNADPWGWRMTDLTHNTFNENGWPIGHDRCTLKNFKLDESGKGVFEGLKGVTVLRDGKLMTEVQSVFSKGESHIVLNYKIYHDTKYIDVNIHALWNETSKGLKIKFPINGSDGYFAQMAFGIEEYKNNRIEYPMNRYVGTRCADNAFVIYNKSGIHSVSKIGKSIYLTLFNGSAYCAHPIEPTANLTIEKERFVPYIEQGAHDYSLRLSVNKMEECERIAKEFNEPLYSLSSFPHGSGEDVAKDIVVLSNKNIVIEELKRLNDSTYAIRLYNGTNKTQKTVLSMNGITKEITLTKFAFETFVFDKKQIKKAKSAAIY